MGEENRDTKRDGERKRDGQLTDEERERAERGRDGGRENENKNNLEQKTTKTEIDTETQRESERVSCSAERSMCWNQEVQHIIKHLSKEWGPCKMSLPNGERALVLQLPVSLGSETQTK